MAGRVLRVNRHSSERGRWEMVHAAPATPLWPHVRRYCGYSERSAEPVRRSELPGSLVTVILSLGPTIEVAEPAARARSPQRLGSFVAALHDRPATTAYTGEQHGLEVNLDPCAAHGILGVPMHELTGRAIELTDVLEGADRRLPERLQDEPTWEARFALLDCFLGARLEAAREPPPELALAVSRLRRSGGGAPIAALAREAGWSQRRLVRGFREQVGMHPKGFARLLRFERVIRRLHAEGGAALGEIALDCGYYDQSHLNRDFRQFAGVSPTRYVARTMPDGGGVAAGDFVQDPAYEAA